MAMDERYLSFGEQKKYKFILVGDSNVGKTALFWRFVQGEFHSEKSTLVTTVDFKMKNITLKGKPAKLYIWDTAGQQKYRSIVSTYFKGCHGILLIFDVSLTASKMPPMPGTSCANPKPTPLLFFQSAIKQIQETPFPNRKQRPGRSRRILDLCSLRPKRALESTRYSMSWRRRWQPSRTSRSERKVSPWGLRTQRGRKKVGVVDKSLILKNCWHEQHQSAIVQWLLSLPVTQETRVQFSVAEVFLTNYFSSTLFYHRIIAGSDLTAIQCFYFPTGRLGIEGFRPMPIIQSFKDYNKMRITIKLILSLSLLLIIASSNRANLTDFYSKLLNSTLPYLVYSSYGDIEKYYPSQSASIYYSAWECSTRRYSDHSTPVVFYLSGGPGLSSQFAAFREFGPLEILYNNGEYRATENSWSWNYYAHLVFVDLPIGVGFSYSKVKTVESSKTIALHFINFLNNFFETFTPSLKTNPFYLAGQGYAGQYISAIGEQISKIKSLDAQLQGIILGGAIINPQKQHNTYESFLSGAGIVSPRARNLAHSWQNQAIIKLRNGKNVQARAFVDKLWSADSVNKLYNGMSVYNYKSYRESTKGNAYAGLLQKYKSQMGVPDNVNFVQYSSAVNSAMTVDMYRSFASSLQNILNSGKRVLIYTGQNSLYSNPAGMFTFLQDLAWKGARQWRQAKKQVWKESGRISGWLKKHSNLMVAVIKGAGHYIYQDDTSSDRSMYLMMHNYFSKKW